MRFSDALRNCHEKALFLKVDIEGEEGSILEILASSMRCNRLPPSLEIVLIVAEISWDNRDLGLIEYRAWLKKLQDIGSIWKVAAIQDEAPPPGVKSNSFKRAAVNAGSRLEICYLKSYVSVH